MARLTVAGPAMATEGIRRQYSTNQVHEEFVKDQRQVIHAFAKHVQIEARSEGIFAKSETADEFDRLRGLILRQVQDDGIFDIRAF